MTIEGLKDFEAVRDFLYSRMRGVKSPVEARRGVGEGAVLAGEGRELEAVLREVAAEVRKLRQAVERKKEVEP